MRGSQKAKHAVLLAIALSLLCGVARAQELGLGHRVLVERGLQLASLTFPVETGYFDVDRWAESNFTTPDLFYHTYLPTIMPAAWPGIPWSRWMHPEELDELGADPANAQLYNWEDPYVPNLVRLQLKDEQDITDPDELATLVAAVGSLRAKYPNVILHTDQGGPAHTAAELRNYMQVVEPDMLMFGCYPYDGTVPGGSPTELYVYLQKYRKLGLAGNDGTGDQPIPVGRYTQTFRYSGVSYHTASESEIRLDEFSAWAFGCKVIDAFVYEQPMHCFDNTPIMFAGGGTTSPTTQFYQVAETNRQSSNLGPALVRLISSDVRMKMGRHKVYTSIYYNTQPDDVSTWTSTADPYITNITATNLGTNNDGYEGDVIVGYFEPLAAEFTNAGHEDDIYFMIVNGLSDGTGLASDCEQRIRLDFDFGTSGIDSLLRMSRETGLIEDVALVSTGGSSYYLDLYLDGGTGDLFKFNNGGTFVGISAPTEAIWTGIGSTTWSTATGLNNWKDGGGATVDYANDVDVTFDDTATGLTANIFAANVTPSSVLFDNTTKDFTVQGTKGIAGSTGLTKQGTGKVTLTSVNTYTGLTAVEAGTLELGLMAQAPVLTGGGADIQGGEIVLDYAGGSSPAAVVKAALAASYATGFASGQIYSSMATTAIGLGWVDDTGASELTVAYSLYGDTNLDGSVDFTDLSKLLAGYDQPGDWAEGDFDYSGAVAFADLSKMLANYDESLPSVINVSSYTLDASAIQALSDAGITVVPEPSSLIMLVSLSVLAGLLWRQTRLSGLGQVLTAPIGIINTPAQEAASNDYA